MDSFIEKIYSLFTGHRFVAYLSSASLALVLGSFIWAFLALTGVGSDSLILHFNGSDGITVVGGVSSIIFTGIFAFAVAVANFGIAVAFDRRDRFFGKFLAVATLTAAILLFFGTAAIINANV